MNSLSFSSFYKSALLVYIFFMFPNIYAIPSIAQLELPEIFSDNMVLQCGVEVPVWGWAGPGKTVKIQFHGNEVSAIADSQGHWKAFLPSMEADNNANSMEISAPGEIPIILSNILVGEVWLCSGQSNMRFQMSFRMPDIPGVINWKEEIAEADDSK